MVFRAFRLIVGLILGALSAWLIGGSALEIVHARGEDLAAGMLLLPVLKIVAGLLVLAFTYWALWAESSLRRALEKWGYMERPKAPWLRLAPEYQPKPMTFDD